MKKRVSSGSSSPKAKPASIRVRHGESLMAKVTVTFTITELCLRTGVSEEELTEIVGLGMIEPHQPQAETRVV